MKATTAKKRVAIAVAAAVTVSLFGITVAYADVAGEVMSSVITSIITTISGLMGELFDLVVEPVFSITTMTVDQIAVYVPGFDMFAGAIQAVAWGVFAILSCLSIVQTLYGYMQGNEKVSSPGAIVFRIMLGGIVTGAGLSVLRIFMNDVVSPIAVGFAANAQNGAGGWGFGSLIGQDMGIVDTIIAVVLLVMIGINVIKLVLEAAERYIICIVIIHLSPLAFATAANKSTASVSQSWFKMFWSQSVLLILNIWCVAIARKCFPFGGGGNQALITWGLVTYGLLKIFQKLDDMMQNAGLSITRTGNEFWGDMIAATSMIGKAAGATFSAAGAGTAAVHAAAVGGDVWAPISRLGERHPVVAGAMGAGGHAVAAMTGMTAKANALRDIDGVSDAARAAQQASTTKPINYGDAAHKTAVQGMLAANKSGAFTDAIKSGAQVETLKANPDGSLSGSLVKRNADGTIAQAQNFSVSSDGKTTNIKPLASAEVAYNHDTGAAMVHSNEAGDFILEKKDGAGKYGQEVYEATQVADAHGNPVNPQIAQSMELALDKDSAGLDNAASQFVTQGSMQELGNAYEQEAINMEAAKPFVSPQTSNAERIRDLSEGVEAGNAVNYNDAPHLAAATEVINENGIPGVAERLQVLPDGQLEGQAVVRDASGNVTKETDFLLSGNEQTMPTGEKTVVPDFDTKFETTYSPSADDMSGVINNAMGTVQISRVAVDEATGNSTWQVVQTMDGEGNKLEEPQIAEIVRRGEKGKPVTFSKVSRLFHRFDSFIDIAELDDGRKK